MQVSNLRLLFPPLKPSFPVFPNSKPYTLLTALSSDSKRRRPFPSKPRRHSTFRHRDKPPMEDSKPNESVSFNKRRAEGIDRIPKKSLQRNKRVLNPTNTIAYVQFLGTGMDTLDTSPSVLLFFDKQRFIFNAGEGLQRFCTEHKIRLSKIDHIFLSRVCSETAGGIPGLLLTLAGMGEEGMSVNVWGPSDLKLLVDAMKNFIPNAAMVHTRSFGPTHDSLGAPKADETQFTDPIVLVDDEVVKLSAIFLRPRFSEGSQHLNGVPVMHNPIEKILDDSIDHASEPIRLNGRSMHTGKPGDMSVLYVCELPEIKGKFDPVKAKALGVRPGPKYHELQLGNSVESDNKKTIVHSSDVMGPSVPGPIVLLVDCPSESHFQKLLSVQCLSSCYTDFSGPPDDAKVVTCVIHLSPSSLISSSKYQRWMNRFGSTTQHIVAGHERKNMEIPILKASARVAARLNYLCPQFFPAPGFWSTSSSEGSVCENISAENLVKFTLRPYVHLGLDRSMVPSKVNAADVINDLLLENPEIVDAAQCVRQFWRQSTETKEEIRFVQEDTIMVEEPWFSENTLPSCLENIRRDDMEIVLLGTGSCQPSKYCNVSVIHINLFSNGGLLLDCGEGTLGQLKRRYGVEDADNAVRGLRCIWISHIHADHHTGLARVLALRRTLLKGGPHEPILVVGPRQLKSYLDAYQRLEDLDMKFLDCRNTTDASLNAPSRATVSNINHFSLGKNGQQKVESTIFAKGSRMESYWKKPGSPVDDAVSHLQKVLAEAGLESLISVPVVHCSQSFGVVLKASERLNSAGKMIPGWKLVYSGDTRPCQALVEASRGATILIHEATFEDGMEDEAIKKNHSTTEEAISVGNSAGVYRVLLTRFSQRYPKIPVFDEAHMHKTCIAFDLMSINMADLPVLPKVLPYLKMLFKNEMAVDESDGMLEAESVA